MNCELKDRIVSMCELCDTIEKVMQSSRYQAHVDNSYRDIFFGRCSKIRAILNRNE